MADASLRELERAAAAGDHRSRVRLLAARKRAGLPTRDPRKDPRPGDVVYVGPDEPHRHNGLARRIVACPPRVKGWTPGDPRWAREQPEGWRGRLRAWWCTGDYCGFEGAPCGYVHWKRTEGKGPRAGTLQLRSWRNWARGGEILEVGVDA